MLASFDDTAVSEEIPYEYYITATNGVHEGLPSLMATRNLVPIAEFTTNPVEIVAGQTITFTFTGAKGNLPTTLQWDFGDGTENATADDPIHQYTDPGSYLVTLTVNDSDGDISVSSHSVMVLEDLFPVAAFTTNASQIQAGQSVMFTFTGDKGNLPANLQWNFGDGSPDATADNPVHQYLVGGVVYTVGLTVTDRNGDQHSTTQTIIVQLTTNEPDIPANGDDDNEIPESDPADLWEMIVENAPWSYLGIGAALATVGVSGIVKYVKNSTGSLAEGASRWRRGRGRGGGNGPPAGANPSGHGGGSLGGGPPGRGGGFFDDGDLGGIDFDSEF
jgi:PKD repeat protein